VSNVGTIDEKQREEFVVRAIKVENLARVVVKSKLFAEAVIVRRMWGNIIFVTLKTSSIQSQDHHPH
jgi:hypothetical protein